MSDPPLNIEYWSSLYRMYEEDNEEYEAAIEKPALVDRARHLWKWKDLSRSIEFEDIAPVIKRLDMDDYLAQSPATAIEELRDTLQVEGVIQGKGLVTPAFLLHLAASGPDESSVEFPIYDRRVWNAYAYLWRVRDEGERLYRAASQSPDRYEEFCQDFRTSCPDDEPRRYEQALFMFGGYIMGLASGDEPAFVEQIDTVLTDQERALRQSQETAGYTMVNVETVRTR